MNKIKNYFLKFIFSEYFPVLCCFIVLVLGFVTIRMRGIEQDYAYNKLHKETKQQNIINKERKARKASLLSVNSLQSFANKYKLKLPTQDQIIVIK